MTGKHTSSNLSGQQKEETWEPLNGIAVDDHVIGTCNTNDNDLLELPDWKRFKRLAAHEKNFIQMLSQLKLMPPRRKMLSITLLEQTLIPRNCDEALAFDEDKWQCFLGRHNKKRNGEDQSLWVLLQMLETKVPSWHQNACGHLTFANKFDMKRMAKLLLSGQLTPPSSDKSYSVVVSLEGGWNVLLLAELNEPNLCAADITQAYLEANKRKKLQLLLAQNFETFVDTHLSCSKHSMRQGLRAMHLLKSWQMSWQILGFSSSSYLDEMLQGSSLAC